MKHKVQYNAKKSYYLECLVCGRTFSGTVPYEYQPVQNQMMNMPQLAKAKHMEMSVPEKELWRYSGGAMFPSQKH